MSLRDIGQFRNRAGAGSLNMTPVIDIVFQLIIFFVLVCRFVEAENFPVTVPAGCDFAQDDAGSTVQVTTLTVMNGADGVVFAVGPEEVPAGSAPGGAAITERLVELLNVRLARGGGPSDNRIVTLRIDRDIPFAHAQYALAAVARSSAADVRLAVSAQPPQSKEKKI